MISVIITSYNYSQYIKDAIQSVIDQTYNDWELIIIDDCSKDNSVDIIKTFNDKRIKLIINKQNLGLTKSIKRGIEKASGNWIAFLESDDFWAKNYLEEKIKIIKTSQESAVIFNNVEMFGNIDKINYFNKKYPTKFFDNKKFPKNMFFDITTKNRLLTLSAVCIKKDLFSNFNFNVKDDRFFDWWLLIHVARKNKFYYIPQKLTFWRLHKNSYVNKKDKNIKLPTNMLAYFDIFIKEKDLISLLLAAYILFRTIIKKYLFKIFEKNKKY